MLSRKLSPFLILFLVSCHPFGKKQTASEPGSLVKQANSQNAERYVVVFKDSVEEPESVATELANELGGRLIDTYQFALKGFAIEMPQAATSEIETDDRIAYFAKDIPVILSAQQTPPGIERIGSKRSPIVGFDSQTQLEGDIAILDTGIDLDHPDLNIFVSENFSSDESADDLNGHGTHVAGIAAARNNSEGILGVSPGTRLWNLKVLNRDGRGFLCSVISGIDYATRHADEIEVVNMSLNLVAEIDVDDSCGVMKEDALHQAICGAVEKGVVFVAAGGNASRDALRTAPANYPEVIAVSAIVDTDGIPGGLGPALDAGADDSLASFSNFGGTIDIAAPGAEILSTANDGGTTVKSGTSMAAPHVTGAVNLMILAGEKPRDKSSVMSLKDLLVQSATPQSDDSGYAAGKSNTGAPLLNIEQIIPKETPLDDEPMEDESPQQSPVQK